MGILTNEGGESGRFGQLGLTQPWPSLYSQLQGSRARNQESKLQSGGRCCSVPLGGLGVPALWGLPVRGSVTSVCSQAHSRQNMEKQPPWLWATQVPGIISCVQEEFEELRSSAVEPPAQGHG